MDWFSTFGTDEKTSAAFVLGGMAGATYRAVFSTTQKTISSKTIADIIAGGLSCLAIPYTPILNMMNWTLVPPGVKAIMAAGIGLFGTWTLTMLQWRFRKDGPPEILNAAPPPFAAESQDEYQHRKTRNRLQS